MLRLSSLLCLLCLLACTAEEGPTLPTAAVTSLRYQEDSQELRVELVVSPADTLNELAPPTFLGTGMQRPNPQDLARYLSERTLPLPTDLRFGVPRTDGSRTDVAFTLSPPVIDQLPLTLSRSTGITFPALAAPLREGQSLELFFEPSDRGRPHRIIINGPYASTQLELPARALADIPAGKYSVYLIGQQLDKGEREGLQYSIQSEVFTRSVPVTVTE